jgi:hypothetical protein
MRLTYIEVTHLTLADINLRRQAFCAVEPNNFVPPMSFFLGSSLKGLVLVFLLTKMLAFVHNFLLPIYMKRHCSCWLFEKKNYNIQGWV